MAKRVYGTLSLASLIIGMAIYLFFRNMNIVLFDFLPKPQFLDRFFIPIKPSAFASVLLYNIPDILWFLSGLFFLRYVWFHEPKWQRVYIACFCIIAFVLEISQISKNVPGTFDFMDLLIMAIAAFIEGLLFNIFFARRIV